MAVFLTNGLSTSAQTVPDGARRILIVNLMPNRAEVERQYAKLLAAVSDQLQEDIALIFAVPSTHQFKHDVADVYRYYAFLADVVDDYFDGVIATGAPLDQVSFETVDYWAELQRFFIWTKTHATQSIWSCWSASAFNYAHGIAVQRLAEKQFGVYQTPVGSAWLPQNHVSAPHSRWFKLSLAQDGVIAGDENLGAVIVQQQQNLLLAGHHEYGADVLWQEYTRDQHRGLAQLPPENGAVLLQAQVAPWFEDAVTLYTAWFEQWWR